MKALTVHESIISRAQFLPQEIMTNRILISAGSELFYLGQAGAQV